MAGRKRAQQDAEGTSTAAKKQRHTYLITSVTTRGAKRKSLSNAVFLTTELLENVLQFLPMKDLLISQRVARKWRAVISGSKQLQQALFMLPREAETGWKLTRQDPRSIDSVETVSLRDKGAINEEDDAVIVKHGELNPMFFIECLRHHDIWDSLQIDGNVIFHVRDDFYQPRAKRSWARQPEASWRKMFVTQPPGKSFWYHWVCEGGPLKCEDVSKDRELSIQDFVEELERFEDVHKGPFDFLSHFMTVDEENFVVPHEGDQAEIDRFMAEQQAMTESSDDEE